MFFLLPSFQISTSNSHIHTLVRALTSPKNPVLNLSKNLLRSGIAIATKVQYLSLSLTPYINKKDLQLTNLSASKSIYKLVENCLSTWI